MSKFQKRQRPAKSIKRMMNQLFDGLSQKDILAKLNKFTLHKPFFFLTVDKKKDDPAQLNLFKNATYSN